MVFQDASYGGAMSAAPIADQAPAPAGENSNCTEETSDELAE